MLPGELGGLKGDSFSGEINLNAKCDGKTDRQTNGRTDRRAVRSLYALLRGIKISIKAESAFLQPGNVKIVVFRVTIIEHSNRDNEMVDGWVIIVEHSTRDNEKGVCEGVCEGVGVGVVGEGVSSVRVWWSFYSVRHFQDMAPDTKVPDGRTAGRTTPKQYPSASGRG
ncbi:hypothetical protein DPMN_140143 [Dreissena polymorpha]|uniref:Uncharacterized protein n=1 Tax=Dreissena polymorpha TaxID=45954 RepID=A0A9D4JK43_DREPO|nr:hypothetical protein DPMN_140143 [Dreissena polymorpha]